jgi:hypothetical protein
LIQSATKSLISNQQNKNNYLYQQFQKSRHLFDSENRVDHRLKRAKEKVELKKNAPFPNTARSGKSKLVNEQRFEILDYYEMNQKVIDSTKESLYENEKLFKNIKKLNEMSAQNKKITRGDFHNLSNLQRIQTNNHSPIKKVPLEMNSASSFYKSKNIKSSVGNLQTLSPIRVSKTNKK